MGTVEYSAVNRRTAPQNRTVRYSLSRTKPSPQPNPTQPCCGHSLVQDFLCVVYEVLEFIDQAIESGGRVFVHCRSVCKEGLLWLSLQPYYNMRESHAKSGWLSILVSGRLARHWCCCVPGCSSHSAPCVLRFVTLSAFSCCVGCTVTTLRSLRILTCSQCQRWPLCVRLTPSG